MMETRGCRARRCPGWEECGESGSEHTVYGHRGGKRAWLPQQTGACLCLLQSSKRSRRYLAKVSGILKLPVKWGEQKRDGLLIRKEFIWLWVCLACFSCQLGIQRIGSCGIKKLNTKLQRQRAVEWRPLPFFPRHSWERNIFFSGTLCKLLSVGKKAWNLSLFNTIYIYLNRTLAFLGILVKVN